MDNKKVLTEDEISANWTTETNYPTMVNKIFKYNQNDDVACYASAIEQYSIDLKYINQLKDIVNKEQLASLYSEFMEDLLDTHKFFESFDKTTKINIISAILFTYQIQQMDTADAIEMINKAVKNIKTTTNPRRLKL